MHQVNHRKIGRGVRAQLVAEREKNMPLSPDAQWALTELTRKETLTGCTSYVQRKLQIGFNKAANILEELETAGYISEPDNVGARRLLKADAETRRTAPDDTRLLNCIPSDPSPAVPPTAEQTKTAWKRYQAEQADAAVLNEELVRALADIADNYPIPNGQSEDYSSGFIDATNFIAEAIRSRVKPSP